MPGCEKGIAIVRSWGRARILPAGRPRVREGAGRAAGSDSSKAAR